LQKDYWQNLLPVQTKNTYILIKIK
jgi:hypothetical protein